MISELTTLSPAAHPSDRLIDLTSPGPFPLSVSVIICTWRRPESLRRALVGVLKQTYPAHQVLVGIRPEDSISRDVLAEFAQSGVREVLSPRRGAIAARNAALEVATGDVVAYTDDDAVPTPTWLEGLVAHYLRDAHIGAVGGRDRVYHGEQLLTGELPNVGRILPYGRWVTMLHLGAGQVRDVDLLKGVNMSFRRQWLPDLRWDTQLRGQGAEHHEDSAFSLAIAAAGYRVVYDPNVLVDHYEGERVDGGPRENPKAEAISDWAHNQMYCIVRYLPPKRALMGAAYALCVGTLPAPGLGMGLRRLAAGQSVQEAASAMSYAYRGRFAGIRAGLRARREAHQLAN